MTVLDDSGMCLLNFVQVIIIWGRCKVETTVRLLSVSLLLRAVRRPTLKTRAEAPLMLGHIMYIYRCLTGRS